VASGAIRPSRTAVALIGVALLGFAAVMIASAARRRSEARTVAATLQIEGLQGELAVPGPETPGVLSGLRVPAGFHEVRCPYARTVCFARPTAISPVTAAETRHTLRVVARELGVTRLERPDSCSVQHRLPRRNPYASIAGCVAAAVAGPDELSLFLKSRSRRAERGQAGERLAPRGTTLEVVDSGSVAARRRLEAEILRLESDRSR
jgi:hypothetical protein